MSNRVFCVIVKDGMAEVRTHSFQDGQDDTPVLQPGEKLDSIWHTHHFAQEVAKQMNSASSMLGAWGDD